MCQKICKVAILIKVTSAFLKRCNVVPALHNFNACLKESRDWFVIAHFELPVTPVLSQLQVFPSVKNTVCPARITLFVTRVPNVCPRIELVGRLEGYPTLHVACKQRVK